MSKIVSEYGRSVEISVSWIDCQDGNIPDKAVSAGDSCYVARAKHLDEYIPGKFVQGHTSAYVSYDGKEIAKSEYQILVDSSILGGPSIEWHYTRGNQIPYRSIVGGTDNERPLYIAKSAINGEVVVGKYLPEFACGFFPYGGKEHRKSMVEILCCTTKQL